MGVRVPALEGRRALVTGGGGEIAAAIAALLVARGATVVLADVDEDSAARMAREVGARSAVIDVRDETSVNEVLRQHGPFDVLVNAAAVCSNVTLEAFPEEDWRRDIDVVLGGAIRTARVLLPHMRAQGHRGAIVNISSVNGHRFLGNDVYSAAKAGLISLTRSLAAQYAPYGIRVNSVSPGTIATSAWTTRLASHPSALEEAAAWYPLGRVGTPLDVAQAVVFLADDAQSGWVTGIDLPVDGGLLSGCVSFARGIGAATLAPPSDHH